MTPRRHIPWHYRWSTDFSVAHRYGIAAAVVMIGLPLAGLVYGETSSFKLLVLTLSLPIAAAAYMLGLWGK
jgi:hypothetical protein